MQKISAIRHACPLIILWAACGSSPGSHPSQRAQGETAAGLDDCGSFWEMLQNVGDYAEGYASFEELVRGSDVVAFGPFVPYDRPSSTPADPGAEPAPPPRPYQPKIGLSLGADPEILKGRLEIPELLLAGVPPLDSACLPSSPVLVLARWWEEAKVYRPVNGYGIWASTGRAAVDTPLILDRAVDGRLYENELSQYQSFDEFVNAVRELASRLD